jgi:hypothetical protein
MQIHQRLSSKRKTCLLVLIVSRVKRFIHVKIMKHFFAKVLDFLYIMCYNVIVSKNTLKSGNEHEHQKES